jgi:hypothetical protein
MVSNGLRRENSAIIMRLMMQSAAMARLNTLLSYRCANGSESGRVYAPMTAITVAMIWSAGTEAPMRPV